MDSIKTIKSLINEAEVKINEIEIYIDAYELDDLELWAFETIISGYKKLIKKMKKEIKNLKTK